MSGPWMVVRYGLRHRTVVRTFRRRWTAAIYRVIKYWPVLDMYAVERWGRSGGRRG